MMLELPYPPSVNAVWRNIIVKGRPRTVLSVEGRQYRTKVRAGLVGWKPLEGPVAVDLRVYRPRRIGDLDNTAKAVLDAVKGLLFVDDSQVVALHMYRFDDKARPRIEMMLLPVPPLGGNDVSAERKAMAAMRARHTDACLAHLTDPGATCVCRPPAVVEPLADVDADITAAAKSIARFATPNVRKPR